MATDPTIPTNGGCYRSLELITRPGSVVSAQDGVAVAAGNVETSQRVVDVLLGALGVAAASQGTMNTLAMGRRGEGGWDYYETLAGGMALQQSVSTAWQQITGGRIIEGYGLTESSPVTHLTSSDASFEVRTETVGTNLPHQEVKIVDPATGTTVELGEAGEVCFRGYHVMKGYFRKPEATAEAFIDGWFHTGDVGYMDENGFVYIVDRIKEIIIRGGENISCLEVEAAIYTHPAVYEAAVFGLPDERLGEIVGAAIVLKEGAELTSDDLRSFLAEHLAGFKIPAHIWFRDEQLPRIASGKIFKRQLKSDYAGELGLS